MPSLNAPNSAPICMLCRHMADPEDLDGIHVLMHCSNCGEYEFSDCVRVVLETLPGHLLCALSRAVQEGRKQHQRTVLDIQNLARLAAAYL